MKCQFTKKEEEEIASVVLISSFSINRNEGKKEKENRREF